MDVDRIIRAAKGDEEVDLLLTDARIINVFSGEIVSGDIAVSAGYIVGFGSYSARERINLNQRFVAPGLIDAHVHIESSMVCIPEFARAVIPHGTTAVVADPHEIGNVLGVEGIQYMLDSSENLPLKVYFTFPSCVPATHMETAGATLGPEDLIKFINNERIVALGEMMNYPGVIFRDPQVMNKISITLNHRKPVDGHAPGLSGPELNAYIAAGITSDHECTRTQEAEEKLKAGMYIMIREGTSAKNLESLFPIIREQTYHRLMWCTDDRHPNDLMSEGHMNSILERAIHLGLDPVKAFQMATINPAQYFGIKETGAVAPGKRADLLIFSNLEGPFNEQVYCSGIKVAENGQALSESIRPADVFLPSSMKIKADEIDWVIPARSNKVRVIEIVPDQIITRHVVMEAAISKDVLVSDISRDLLKIAVVDRHSGKGKTGKGFVRGFGLKRGALASSVAHDSHNIVLIGTNDADMKTALAVVVDMGGGLAAVCDGEVKADLPLPIAGLMSADPVNRVRRRLDRLIEVTRGLGSSLNDPFMTMSFLALPVIPELKITDKGLVDVVEFKVVPLFVE